MSEQYLILHKVRGEPAFDVAEQIPCPNCESARQGLDYGNDYAGSCSYCDDGHWWIIPTSGHRAYPYWNMPLEDLYWGLDAANLAYDGFTWKTTTDTPDMPTDWPDHYQVKAEGPKVQINVAQILSGLTKFKFKRRM